MRRFARVMVTVLLLTGAAGAVVPPASAGCAAPSSKFLAGTINGEDGRHVNTVVGFDVVDSTGRKLKMDGCLAGAGYTAVQWINPKVPGTGVAPSGTTTGTWRLPNLPSNATNVWIKTYPKNPQGQHDFTRYAKAMRRKVPVNLGNIRLRNPVVCSAGGTTGQIEGHVTTADKTPILPDRIYAWSEAYDTNNAILGWGSGAFWTGYYKIPNLAANQTYAIWLIKGSRVVKRYKVPVYACRSTPVWLVY